MYNENISYIINNVTEYGYISLLMGSLFLIYLSYSSLFETFHWLHKSPGLVNMDKVSEAVGSIGFAM